MRKLLLLANVLVGLTLLLNGCGDEAAGTAGTAGVASVYEAAPATTLLSTDVLISDPVNTALAKAMSESVSENDSKMYAGKKVAIIAESGVEEIELTMPYKYFQDRGATVHCLIMKNSPSNITLGIVASPIRDTHIFTFRALMPGGFFKIDAWIEDVNASDYDALILPGGYSPDNCRSNKNVTDFVKKMVTDGKPVGAICHGPSLLVSADVLRNKTATSWFSIRDDLRYAGAKVVDYAPVVDGNIITARYPPDLLVWVEAIGKQLSSQTREKENTKEKARRLAAPAGIVGAYEPDPVTTLLSTEVLVDAPFNAALAAVMTSPVPQNETDMFKGKKIAIIAESGVEEIELTFPHKYFNDRGASAVHLTTKPDPSNRTLGIIASPTRDKYIYTFRALMGGGYFPIGGFLEDTTAAEWDALVIPGGYSPDNNRANENVTNFVKAMVAANKPVGAICHGPSLLVSADALQNKTATAWYSILDDLRNAGATVVDYAPVIDGNIITARYPPDLLVWVEAIGNQVLNITKKKDTAIPKKLEI